MRASELFTRRHVVYDGAMGTTLQQAGLPVGVSPDHWCITHPDAVLGVHRAYLEAGAEVVLSNTLGANAIRQKRGPYTASELAEAGVRLARRAVDEHGAGYAALDVGALGEFLEPMGDLTFEEAVELFRAPVEAGAAAGADLVCIETMYDITEALAAVQAAKSFGGGMPVVCTLTFDANGRLLTGMPVEQAVEALEQAGVDALGCNCGVGPEQLIALLPRFTACAHVPLLMKPNAGLPAFVDGKSVYLVGPEDFAADMKRLADGGVWGLGGCCGTTAAHIAALAAAVR